MNDKISITTSFARQITSLGFEDIPEPLIQKVKACVFHVLACSFNGHHLPWSQTAINYLKTLNTKGTATSFIDGIRAPSPDVAFVNSVLAHSIIQEDQHLATGSHPGTMVIPAALAVGEETNCTGKDLVTAIVLGYELIGRIGVSVMSFEFMSKFRPSSFWGPYGACAAASRLLGLNQDQAANALGMAGNLSMGFQQCFTEGTDDFYFHNGFTSSNGVRAAMLGKMGIHASKFIIEGSAGFWNGYKRQPAADRILEGLGQSYEISSVYFKPVPSCAMVQTAVQLAHRMSKTRTINPEEINNIEIRTFQAAMNYPGVHNPGPFTNMLQAKLSLEFGVAAALTFKELNQSIYDRYNDPLVSGIAANSVMIVDENIEKTFSQTFQQGCRINVVMKDKSVISDSLDNVTPMTDEQVADNFKTQANRFLKHRQAEELTDSIYNLEKIENIREMTKLFVKK